MFQNPSGALIPAQADMLGRLFTISHPEVGTAFQDTVRPTGAAASIVLPAVANTRYVINYCYATFIKNAGVNTGVMAVTLTDNVLGELWSDVIVSNNALGRAIERGFSNNYVFSGLGSSVTLAAPFSGTATDVWVLSLGGYTTNV